MDIHSTFKSSLRRARRLRVTRAHTLAIAMLAISVTAADVLALTTTTSKGPFDPQVIATQPDRVEKSADPGETVTFPFAVQNRTKAAITAKISLREIQSAKQLVDVFDIVDDAQFGVSHWLELEQMEIDLESGVRAIQTATIRVPDDADPGSYYAVIQVLTEPVSVGSSGTDGTGVKSVSSVQSQVYITVSGAKNYGLKLLSAHVPSWVQRSDKNLVPIEAVVKNDGNVTDLVGGKIVVRSMFGTVAATIPLEEGFILREGKREFRGTWTNVPWVGVFTPTVELKGRDGKVKKMKAERIFVTPPWPYLAGLAAALLIPIMIWIRRRREWKSYVDDFPVEETID